jgi:hypothetical protein
MEEDFKKLTAGAMKNYFAMQEFVTSNLANWVQYYQTGNSETEKRLLLLVNMN